MAFILLLITIRDFVAHLNIHFEKDRIKDLNRFTGAGTSLRGQIEKLKYWILGWLSGSYFGSVSQL